MYNRREFLIDVSNATTGLFFVGCGLAESVLASMQTGGRGKRRQVVIGGRRVLTVDVHCHCTIPDAWDLIQDEEAQNLQIGQRDPNSPKGPQLDPRNVNDRLADMDEQGIDEIGRAHV